MSIQNLTTEALHNVIDATRAMLNGKGAVLDMTFTLASRLRKAIQLSRPNYEDVLRAERHREDMRNHAIRMMSMGR